MKKMAFLLVSTMISLSSCKPNFWENDSVSSVALSFANNYSVPPSFLITPKRSSVSDVFLVGWKLSDSVGYDISVLSNTERQCILENGIAALINDADKAEYQKTNRTLLAHYYYSKQEFKKAIYWAFKGVESGSASCMHILSQAYLSGEEGVVKDFEEGLKWAYLGAACGNESCKAYVDSSTIDFVIRKDLRGLILASQRKATEWMKEHAQLFAAQDPIDERVL